METQSNYWPFVRWIHRSPVGSPSQMVGNTVHWYREHDTWQHDVNEVHVVVDTALERMRDKITSWHGKISVSLAICEGNPPVMLSKRTIWSMATWYWWESSECNTEKEGWHDVAMTLFSWLVPFMWTTSPRWISFTSSERWIRHRNKHDWHETSLHGNVFRFTGRLCSTVVSHHKGPVMSCLVLSALLSWTSCWINNQLAGD